MLLGILSDTHDRGDTASRAVRVLRERGAEFLVHCGDVCEPGVLDCLAGLPAGFVWGNCDWDRAALERYADAIGVTCYGQFGDLELGGRRIAVTHGDDRARMDLALHGGEYDYLLHGHTHVRRDERVGETRVINPGALFRATEKTVALLDLATDGVEFIVIT